MKITDAIENRIEQLIEARKYYIDLKDYNFAAQLWARIDELKELKKRFTDKEGNWLI